MFQAADGAKNARGVASGAPVGGTTPEALQTSKEQRSSGGIVEDGITDKDPSRFEEGKSSVDATVASAASEASEKDIENNDDVVIASSDAVTTTSPDDSPSSSTSATVAATVVATGPGSGKPLTDLNASTAISEKAQNLTDWSIIRRLAGNIWPKGQWEVKTRVVAAVALLIGGKVLNVQVPFFFKDIVDKLNVPIGEDTTVWVLAGAAISGCELLSSVFVFVFVFFRSIFCTPRPQSARDH